VAVSLMNRVRALLISFLGAAVLMAALSYDAVLWAQDFAAGFPGGGGRGIGLLNALYCQLASPCVLTGDNASGTGTLRIRPPDEDTQLVLCDQSNNSSPEVCAAFSFANFSTNEPYLLMGNNTYYNTSTSKTRYNTSRTAPYVVFRGGNSDIASGVYMGAINLAGTDVGLWQCALNSGGTTATCTASSGNTTDLRGPILNGGAAPCNGVSGGALCHNDLDNVFYGTGTTATIHLGSTTNPSNAQIWQYAQGTGGQATTIFATGTMASPTTVGSFGYYGSGTGDADYADMLMLYSFNKTLALEDGQQRTATQQVVRVMDNVAATGEEKLGIYGAGTVTFPQTQTVTCADNAGGTNATQTLDPQAHTITVLNNDATGCDVTMQETSAQLGAVIVVCIDPASTATNVNFADVANVFNGAAPALSQGDCFTARYFDAANDLWLQTGASNN